MKNREYTAVRFANIPDSGGNYVELTPEEQFAAACGAVGPVVLRVLREDDVLLAEGALDLVSAVLGRSPDVDVTLTHPDVSLRHAMVQVIGGRVVVADLGSRMGTAFNRPFAWLTPTDPVALGPFRLLLAGPVSDRSPTGTKLSDPFHPPAEAMAAKVVMQFLSGKTKTREWVVNRPLTFLGRSKNCKITLTADTVAPVHAGLVLTPFGLWVVDFLSKSGITVNDLPVRFKRLLEGDVLAVGQFRFGFHYPYGIPPLPEPRVEDPKPSDHPGKLTHFGPIVLPASDTMAAPFDSEPGC